MILFSRFPTADQETRILALFGLGLVGSAVAHQAKMSGLLQEERLDLNWEDSNRQADQLEEVRNRIGTAFHRQPDAPRTLAVLWSAGKAGFGCREEEAGVELSNYHAILHLLRRVYETIPRVRLIAAHISSAGGLFEGQRHVSAASRPKPRCPYGWLKWRQEEALRGMEIPLRRLIFRPTSIYGYIRPGQRLGLIPTLILNGLRHRASFVTGRMSTLRDFIWIEDLASFLAQALLSADPGGTDETFLLASGKPSSIQEMQYRVEVVMARKLYVVYSSEAANSEDITMSMDVSAPGWKASDMSINIRKILLDAIRCGAAARAAA